MEKLQRMSDIVIYEQDHLTRTLLQEWLSEAGYRVRVGAAGDESCGPPADLVIVSVFLPKCRGAQCVRELQTAHPGRPMIAISGQFRSGLDAVGATARALGVQRVFAKPLARDELLRAVRAIVPLRPPALVTLK
jgi:DNA-binding response OmpR family regulator